MFLFKLYIFQNIKAGQLWLSCFIDFHFVWVINLWHPAAESDWLATVRGWRQPPEHVIRPIEIIHVTHVQKPGDDVVDVAAQNEDFQKSVLLLLLLLSTYCRSHTRLLDLLVHKVKTTVDLLQTMLCRGGCRLCRGGRLFSIPDKLYGPLEHPGKGKWIIGWET